MKKAPSILAAALLAAFLSLGIDAASGACTQKICVEDQTCSGSWAECPFDPSADCASSAFTAVCTGNYLMRALVACANGCDACEVCVMVEHVPSGAIVGYCNTQCSVDDCDNMCSVSLIKDQNYFLYVCRTPCNGQDCDDCPGSCRAFGCVCFGLGTCAP